MSPEHTAVLDMISAGKCTQLEIAKKVMVGIHEKHELHLKPFNVDSTLRKVRQIIRDLRLIHSCKILSDVEGYWICESQEQADEYLRRVERTAKAQAKAHMVTYNMMKNLFGVSSAYFEAVAAAEDEPKFTFKDL